MSGSGKTPGQAAYEAFQAAFPYEDWGPWTSIGGHDEVPGSSHAGWEAIAQAARAGLTAENDRLRELVSRFERITTAWTRGMYSAWIDCRRGDPAAAAMCLSEGLDGFGGVQWNGTETGAEWWERTKAEEGL